MNNIKKIITVTFSLLISVSVFSQDTTKAKEFTPSTRGGKVWGYVFGDYYYKLHADSTNRASQYSNQPADMNGFELRRAYLGYDYNFSEKFSAEILLSHEGNKNADNTRAVFLKSANVRWKNIFKNTDLVIGESSTPAWPMLTEKIWGYRSVEKTTMDMRGAGSSTDIGVSLQGKLDEKGNFGYNIMAGNGTGTKFEIDRFKKFYGDVYAKFWNQKIIVDAYGDYERTQLSPYHKSKMTWKAALAYQTEKITVGTEVFQQTLENNSIYTEPPSSSKIDTVDAVATGISFYSRGIILKDKLEFFARYDIYNPDTKFISDNTYSGYSAYNTEMFMTAGFDYTPVKNIHIIPNIWYNSYHSRKNGVVGLAKDDYDMVGRLTFHYIFK